LSLEQWAEFFKFDGLSYPVLNLAQTLPTDREEIGNSFGGYVAGAYKSNGVVFACMLVRLMLFSEARFAFRRYRDGRPQELFTNPTLRVLERPWPGGTTGDLLARAIQDVDLAGNFYAVRDGNTIRRLRPDWVTIVLGSKKIPDQPGLASDAHVIGYAYHPGGPNSRNEVEAFGVEDVCHFAPIPDPEFHYRGMSWLTPILRDIAGDKAAQTHKLKFFEQGSSPNLVVTLSADVKREAFETWIELMEQKHAGVANAWRTMYLGGGADAKVIGSNMQENDFKALTGLAETRIAAAAGVPAVVVGISEGLQGSSLNSGNYGFARRRFADLTMRPLWRNMAGSLETIVPPPDGASSLWFDDRDISALQEDVKDAADIFFVKAQAVNALVNSGWDSESAKKAVETGDITDLQHTGLVSVQLQPPGSQQQPSTNGNGRALAPALRP